MSPGGSHGVAQPPTVRMVLGEGAEVATVLRRALDVTGAAGTLGSTVTGQVAGALTGLLELDLGELVVLGWRRHRVLAAAARETADDPAAVRVVELAGHRITSLHRPSVDLSVDDTVFSTVRFELRVDVDVRAVVATVGGGALLALGGGHCDVAVRLDTRGVPLATAQRTLPVQAMVRPGAGIPLLHDPHNGAGGPL